jgi:predicted nucleic acid-binding Zn ribbon protein
LNAGRAGRRRTTKGQRQPKVVGLALQELVDDLGILKPLNGYSVITSWKDIVGEQIAKVAHAERVNDGVLIVKVANAPWRNELVMRRGEILERIVKAVGKGIVREIRFR